MQFGAKHSDAYPVFGDIIRGTTQLPSRHKTEVLSERQQAGVPGITGGQWDLRAGRAQACSALSLFAPGYTLPGGPRRGAEESGVKALARFARILAPASGFHSFAC